VPSNLSLPISRHLTGQGVRFAISGGLVAGVNLGVTTLLGEGIGINFDIAITCGFLIAISLHFTLQRFFVWDRSRNFALPLRHQLGRYLVVAGIQYGATTGGTAAVKGLLGVPQEVAYLSVALAVTLSNFFLLRSRVFHPADPVAL
jgi:putative flippase GtrA